MNSTDQIFDDMRKRGVLIEEGDPRYAASIAGWDYRYDCLKSKADALRALGVPPPPITPEGLAWVEEMQAKQAKLAAQS